MGLQRVCSVQDGVWCMPLDRPRLRPRRSCRIVRSLSAALRASVRDDTRLGWLTKVVIVKQIVTSGQAVLSNSRAPRFLLPQRVSSRTRPLKAGGRGTLRAIAVRVQCAGWRMVHAAGISPVCVPDGPGASYGPSQTRWARLFGMTLQQYLRGTRFEIAHKIS